MKAKRKKESVYDKKPFIIAVVILLVIGCVGAFFLTPQSKKNKESEENEVSEKIEKEEKPKEEKPKKEKEEKPEEAPVEEPVLPEEESIVPEEEPAVEPSGEMQDDIPTEEVPTDTPVEEVPVEQPVVEEPVVQGEDKTVMWKNRIAEIQQMNMERGEKYITAGGTSQDFGFTEGEAKEMLDYLRNEYVSGAYINNIWDESYVLQNAFMSYMIRGKYPKNTAERNFADAFFKLEQGLYSWQFEVSSETTWIYQAQLKEANEIITNKDQQLIEDAAQ